MTGIRIGNTEREAASSQLSDHYAAGRLDDDEYAERLDAIWSARTGDDLKILFHDLPTPVQRVSAPPQRRARRRPSSAARTPLMAILIGVLLLAVIVKVPWWVMLIAAVVLIKKSRRRSSAPVDSRGARQEACWRPHAEARQAR